MALTITFSAEANTVSVTFAGPKTDVNNGADYVLPYQLLIDGILTDATCYDIFDGVTSGQTWTANVLTISDAISNGQFHSDPDASDDYHEVAFLSQQTASTPQDQIDLQEDIWNIFGGNRFTPTSGMQTYLGLLNTPAFTNFDFGSVAFLEDVNQETGRAQAFVISSTTPGFQVPSPAPEPGSVMLLAGGLIVLSVIAFRARKVGAR